MTVNTILETGKHFKRNQQKLESVTESQLVLALKKCRDDVRLRLRKRTLFGAHAEERLGMDPEDYYVSFAYDAVIYGLWEWKDGRTLGDQMVRIAENRIGKEVEKYNSEGKQKFSVPTEEIDDLFYTSSAPLQEPTIVQEAVYSKQISIIEEAVDGDEDLQMFWECIKDGMKADAIADLLEKPPAHVYKLREKLINKIKNSGHFPFE